MENKDALYKKIEAKLKRIFNDAFGTVSLTKKEKRQLDNNLYEITGIKKLKKKKLGNILVYIVFALTVFIIVIAGGLDFGEALKRFFPVPIWQESKVNVAMNVSVENASIYGINNDSIIILSLSDTSDVNIGELKDAIKVEPNVDVNISVKGNEIKIQPQSELEPDTVYTVSIPEGTKIGNKKEIAQTLQYSFVSEPVFEILGVTPSNNAPAYGDTAIEVMFSYSDVSLDSLKEYFSITPNVNGKFEKQDSKIVFIPNEPFVAGVTYSITVSSGVETESGKVLENTFNSQFWVLDGGSNNNHFSTRTNCYSYHEGISVVTVPEVKECYFGAFNHDADGNVYVTYYRASQEDIIKSIKDYHDTGVILQKPREDMESVWNKVFAIDSGSVTIETPNISDGIYLVEIMHKIGSSKLYHYEYLIVSDVTVAYDVGVYGSYGLVANTNDGSAIADVKVMQYDMDGSVLNQATTNGDGMVSFGNADTNTYLVAEYKNKVTFAYNTNPLDFAWMSREIIGYKGFMIYDKPYYGYGDTIRAVGYIKDVNNKYLPPEGQSVKVEIYQANDNKKLSEEVVPYDATTGMFEFTYTVPFDCYDELRVRVMLNDTNVSLSNDLIHLTTIEEGGKVITISTDKEYYDKNDNVIKLQIDGMNANGDPLMGDKAEISVSTMAAYIDMWNVNDIHNFTVDDLLINTEDTLSHDTYNITLQKGNNELEIPIKCNGICNVAINVVLANDLDAFSNTMVHVNKLDWNLLAKSRYDYIKEGGKTIIDFLSANLWNLQNVSNKTANIIVKRAWIERIKRGTEYDEYTKTTYNVYDYITHTEDVYIGNITTGTDGYTLLPLEDLKVGSYTVYWKVNKKEIQLATFFVVSSNNNWGRAGVECNFDKDSYQPGENAKILVHSADMSGKALLLIKDSEKEKAVIVDLSNTLTEVSFEISQDAYNVAVAEILYIDDEYVKYKSWILESAMAYVQRDDKVVNIEIKTDKKDYEIRDNVSLAISTKNGNGNPLDTTLVIAVVDEKLIRLSQVIGWNTNNIKPYDFFYGRHMAKASQGIKRSSLFGDIWGGFGSGGLTVSNVVRSNFTDVALWKTVKTENGQATVTFELPDNITGWHIYTYAIGNNGAVGKNDKIINVKQDAYLRLQEVDYLHDNEQLSVPFEVFNLSDAVIKGTIKAKAEGGCELNDWKNKDVSIPQNSTLTGSVPLKGKTAKDCTISVWIEDSNGQTLDGEERVISVIASKFSTPSYKVLIVPQEGENSITIDTSNIDGGVTVSIPNINSTIYDITTSTEVTSTQRAASVILSKAQDDAVQQAIMIIEGDIKNEGCAGWFNYDACDIKATAFAYTALQTAQEDGYNINSDKISKMRIYLINAFVSNKYDSYFKALILWALSYGKAEDVIRFTSSITNDIDNLDNLSLAYLSWAFSNANSSGVAWSFASKLLEKASISDTTAIWKDNRDSNAIEKEIDVYTTAVVANALSYFTDDKTSDILHKAQTYLIDANYIDMHYISNYLINSALKNYLECDSASVDLYVNDNKVEILHNGDSIRIDKQDSLNIKLVNTGKCDAISVINYKSTDSFTSNNELELSTKLTVTNLSTKQYAKNNTINASVGDMINIQLQVDTKNLSDSGSLIYVQKVPSFMYFSLGGLNIRWSQELSYLYKEILKYTKNVSYGFGSGSKIDEITAVSRYNADTKQIEYNIQLVCSKPGTWTLASGYIYDTNNPSNVFEVQGVIIVCSE